MYSLCILHFHRNIYSYCNTHINNGISAFLSHMNYGSWILAAEQLSDLLLRDLPKPGFTWKIISTCLHWICVHDLKIVIFLYLNCVMKLRYNFRETKLYTQPWKLFWELFHRILRGQSSCLQRKTSAQNSKLTSNCMIYKTQHQAYSIFLLNSTSLINHNPDKSPCI